MSIIERIIDKAGKNEKNSAGETKKEALAGSKVDSSAVELGQESLLRDDAQITDQNSRSHSSEIFSINRERLSREGFLCFEKTTSQLSEEYRMIKRPLINNALNAKKNEISRGNLILVTSSQPGEGKTFTAINLALSIASERDKKVLLIDADVAKPSVSRVLDIDTNRLGLIDYLDGKKSVEFYQMMIKTDVSGLSILPAGSRHGYSTELLASDRMATLADELHSRYPDRIVIFDSPPLLATTQAEVLAELVGQVVLVVEAENTPQSMVSESIAKLKGCDVVLALLNKTQHTVGLNYYGYGQYGQYGQYGH